MSLETKCLRWQWYRFSAHTSENVEFHDIDVIGSWCFFHSYSHILFNLNRLRDGFNGKCCLTISRYHLKSRKSNSMQSEARIEWDQLNCLWKLFNLFTNIYNSLSQVSSTSQINRNRLFENNERVHSVELKLRFH